MRAQIFPPSTDWRQRAPELIVLVAALAFLALHFGRAFMMTPYMEQPGNGTPWAPHSDALGPWLHGGLAYLVGLPPPNYLYRPTVGMFWGSLLAATGRIEMIPVFFLLLLLAACLAVSLFAADRALRGALLLVLAFSAARFPHTWSTLGFDIDLAALAVTFSGMLLVLWDRGKGANAALLVGCVCLGIGAAIRGPLMLAGPVIIAMRIFLMERLERPRTATLLACMVLFLAPIAGDLALQRHLGTVTNGVQGLFCVYSDPSHGWTAACKAIYLESRPAPADVFRNFIAFRLSPEGRDVLLGHLSWRAARDLRLVHSPATFAFILGIAAFASAYRGPRSGSLTPFVKGVLLVATLIVMWKMEAATPAALAWIVLAAVTAAATRHWRALLCLTTYLAGIFFLALAGVANHDRMVNSFAFTLVLGAALLVLEEPRGPPPPPASSSIARGTLATVIAAAVLFLYAGSFVLRSELRATYLREVYRQGTVALKIGDHAAIDRSLYYLSQGQVMYTRHDALPVGSVRKYRALGTDTMANASFVKPNSFVD